MHPFTQCIDRRKERREKNIFTVVLFVTLHNQLFAFERKKRDPSNALEWIDMLLSIRTEKSKKIINEIFFEDKNEEYFDEYVLVLLSLLNFS